MTITTGQWYRYKDYRRVVYAMSLKCRARQETSYDVDNGVTTPIKRRFRQHDVLLWSRRRGLTRETWFDGDCNIMPADLTEQTAPLPKDLRQLIELLAASIKEPSCESL